MPNTYCKGHSLFLGGGAGGIEIEPLIPFLTFLDNL